MSGQLKEVRERISSVMSTQQITKAMKMVSAAKLRKAQQAITEIRPYADKLNQMLVNILSNIEGDASTTFGKERDIHNVAVVVVTSSKGLCGAFNANIIKQTIQLIEGKYGDQLNSGNVTLYCLGKKGNEYFTKYYPKAKVVSDYADIFANLNYESISEVSGRMMDSFKSGQYDRVEVCYGMFKNAATQIPMAVQYIPVQKLEVEEGEAESNKVGDYIFEPSKEKLLEELVPSILHTTFQKFVLDTNASEHGARMTAMDSATENANELLKDLKITYNKARQEAITKELSEIVGGAAALGG